LQRHRVDIASTRHRRQHALHQQIAHLVALSRESVSIALFD
jgi:hypothetical protein